MTCLVIIKCQDKSLPEKTIILNTLHVHDEIQPKRGTEVALHDGLIQAKNKKYKNGDQLAFDHHSMTSTWVFVPSKKLAI